MMILDIYGEAPVLIHVPEDPRRDERIADGLRAYWKATK